MGCSEQCKYLWWDLREDNAVFIAEEPQKKPRCSREDSFRSESLKGSFTPRRRGNCSLNILICRGADTALP